MKTFARLGSNFIFCTPYKVVQLFYAFIRAVENIVPGGDYECVWVCF